MDCHHVMLSSKFISKSLLKCMHLETSSDRLFRRFVYWCVAISNFSFKKRLHFSILRFTGTHLQMIFHAVSAFLFVVICYLFPWKFLFVFILVFVKSLFLICKSFFKSGVTTLLVIFFVIIKSIWVQTDLINDILRLAFSVYIHTHTYTHVHIYIYGQLISA